MESEDQVIRGKVVHQFPDTIEVRRIRLMGRHGVSTAERGVARLLEINVLIRADLSRAQASDSLEDTINYSSVHKRVIDIVQNQSFQLLERLAGAIVDTLFDDVRVQYAQVSIAKPERLDGATPWSRSQGVGIDNDCSLLQHRLQFG